MKCAFCLYACLFLAACNAHSGQWDRKIETLLFNVKPGNDELVMLKAFSAIPQLERENTIFRFRKHPALPFSFIEGYIKVDTLTWMPVKRSNYKRPPEYSDPYVMLQNMHLYFQEQHDIEKGYQFIIEYFKACADSAFEDVSIEELGAYVPPYQESTHAHYFRNRSGNPIRFVTVRMEEIRPQYVTYKNGAAYQYHLSILFSNTAAPQQWRLKNR